MPLLLPARTAYSRAEDRSDAVVHVSGIALAAVAAPVLIGLAAILHADPAAIASASVYGVALLAMLVCSALYNMARHAGRKAIFRHLDHTAIFCKIAATYTPFVVLSGGQGAWLLTGLWGAAVAGSGLRLFVPDWRVLACAIALAMGWAGLFAGGDFFGALSTAVIVLIVTGGILYSVGVAFFLFDRLRFHITIWHIFVLAASGVFYAAVTVHLVQTAT
jgi:hemolysin III